MIGVILGRLAPYIIGVLAIGAVVAWIAGMRHDLAVARQAAAAAMAANEVTVKTLAAERTRHDAELEALQHAAVEAEAARTETQHLLEEIHHAPETHACAAAPAVGIALDRLRQRRADRGAAPAPAPAGGAAGPVPAPAAP